MGTIHYLTKITLSYLFKIRRELSKVMKNETLLDYIELKRLLNYVFETETDIYHEK